MRELEGVQGQCNCRTQGLWPIFHKDYYMSVHKAVEPHTVHYACENCEEHGAFVLRVVVERSVG